MKFKHKVDKTYFHILSFMDYIEIPYGLDAKPKKPSVIFRRFPKKSARRPQENRYNSESTAWIALKF